MDFNGRATVLIKKFAPGLLDRLYYSHHGQRARFAPEITVPQPSRAGAGTADLQQRPSVAVPALAWNPSINRPGKSYVSVAKDERSLFVVITEQIQTHDTHQEKRNGFGADSGMNAAEAIPDTIQCLRQQSRDFYHQQKAKRYKQTCRQTEGYLSTRFGPVIHISAGRFRDTHKKIREIGKGHTKTRLCLSSDSADERSGRRTFSETIRSLHSADETPIVAYFREQIACR